MNTRVAWKRINKFEAWLLGDNIMPDEPKEEGNNNDVSPKPETPLDNFTVKKLEYEVKETVIPPDKVKELIGALDEEAKKGILTTEFIDKAVEWIGKLI